ncbi:MAG: LysM peptidoglycan-binding domain-containing protein [Solirubrobacteraceae bacterium]
MRTLCRATVGTLLGIGAALALPASQASAATAYTTPTGEALATLAASNGLTADQLASWNGLSATSYLSAGETVYIPVPSEIGVSTSSTTSSTTATASTTSTGASHTVVTGDTLSGIAAANGTTADAIAAANGISVDSVITTGQTLAIPSVTSSSTSTTSSAPASGLAPIYCPCGTDYLAAPAAAEWNAMRQASISTYGVDIYPAGPLSAYRTYDQQAYLYQQYLNGTGAPANPPGTSPHELGDSVDVATPEMRSIVDSIGSSYAWGKVHGPSEWWHVDYLGG